MEKNKCSSCGGTKCSCKNKDFTKAVIEIDNQEKITLMRRVVIPASMGDDTTVPPAVGKYHNVLLYYEANQKSYLYSSDGIPTQLVNGVTDYEAAVNLPQINGVTLLGDKSSADLGLADAPMVISVTNGNTRWSGADTAEDVYDFFLNKGKVNIIFNGEENYSYEIASAAYIPGEEKMMCTLAVATIVGGETSEFEGNALFGTMTLYTANKAVDVSQIELQPKLSVADFTGLDLYNNELSGVPATNSSIGMVKVGDGLEVDADGTISETQHEIRVIFPSYTIDGDDTLGDCSIIKTKTKAIMIDTFTDSADTFAGITQALQENDIDKIDILIISHYHLDHIGNYQRLIDSGLIDNARIILPKSVVTGTINETGSAMKTALQNAGLTWEEADNQNISVDDINLRMFNASTEDYAYYTSLEATYNNYSVCVEVQAYGKLLLFTGDCEEPACNYIANTYITESGYDLLKDNHHGFCGYNADYTKKIAPKNVVVPASMGMVRHNLGYRSGLVLNAWGLYTPSIYFQGGQDTAIVVSVTDKAVSFVSNVLSTQLPGARGSFNFYVDSTTTEDIRTGSQRHPFKNLAEANTLLPKYGLGQLIINVLSLGDETELVTFKEYDNLRINFNNNAPSHRIEFYNIGNLYLTDVNLDTTYISIDSCPSVYIGNFTSTANVDEQITVYGCARVLFGGNLTSENAIKSFMYIRESNVEFRDIVLNYTQLDSSARIFEAWGNNITLHGTAGPQFSQYPFVSTILDRKHIPENNINFIEELGTLFDSNTPIYSGMTLKDDIAKYTHVKVEFDTGQGILAREYKVYPYGTTVCPLSTSFLSSDFAEMHTRMARLLLTGTTATTDRQGEMVLTLADGSHALTQTDSIGIRRIIGLVKRYL